MKVWIYKGEVLSQTLRTTPRTMDLSKPQSAAATAATTAGAAEPPGGGYNRDRQGGV